MKKMENAKKHAKMRQKLTVSILGTTYKGRIVNEQYSASKHIVVFAADDNIMHGVITGTFCADDIKAMLEGMYDKFGDKLLEGFKLLMMEKHWLRDDEDDEEDECDE